MTSAPVDGREFPLLSTAGGASHSSSSPPALPSSPSPSKIRRPLFRRIGAFLTAILFIAALICFSTGSFSIVFSYDSSLPSSSSDDAPPTVTMNNSHTARERGIGEGAFLRQTFTFFEETQTRGNGTHVAPTISYPVEDMPCARLGDSLALGRMYCYMGMAGCMISVLLAVLLLVSDEWGLLRLISDHVPSSAVAGATTVGGIVDGGFNNNGSFISSSLAVAGGDSPHSAGRRHHRRSVHSSDDATPPRYYRSRRGGESGLEDDAGGGEGEIAVVGDSTTMSPSGRRYGVGGSDSNNNSPSRNSYLANLRKNATATSGNGGGGSSPSSPSSTFRNSSGAGGGQMSPSFVALLAKERAEQANRDVNGWDNRLHPARSEPLRIILIALVVSSSAATIVLSLIVDSLVQSLFLQKFNKTPKEIAECGSLLERSLEGMGAAKADATRYTTAAMAQTVAAALLFLLTVLLFRRRRADFDLSFTTNPYRLVGGGGGDFGVAPLSPIHTSTNMNRSYDRATIEAALFIAGGGGAAAGGGGVGGGGGAARAGGGGNTSVGDHGDLASVTSLHTIRGAGGGGDESITNSIVGSDGAAGLPAPPAPHAAPLYSLNALHINTAAATHHHDDQSSPSDHHHSVERKLLDTMLAE